MSRVERAQHAVCMQVHASAFQILTLGRVSNHDDVYIKHIVDSTWGLEWDKFTPQTRQCNDYYIRQAYQDMLNSYLPKLRKHLEETEGILKQHSARLAHLVFQPDEAQGENTRDQEARETLGDKYDTYKQGLEHVVKRRAKGPVRKANEVDFKKIGTDLNGKKECPECDKTFTRGAFQRHYRQLHVQDVRHAIYCPEEDCEYVDWRASGDAEIDRHLLTRHNQILNTNKDKTGTGKAESKAKSRVTKPAASEGQEVEQAEQAEQAQDFQGEDGGGARGNATIDVEMADEDATEDYIFFADTSDEDIDDLST